MRWLSLPAVVALLGCGGDDDEVRPQIDPAPYQDACDTDAPCAAPYECVFDSEGDTGRTMCLVPCEADVDCALGFFCNGVTVQADTGALEHCIEDV